MVRLSRIRKWWNDEEFIKDATKLVIEVQEKNPDKDMEEIITWVANSYPEEEQGIIAVYLLGQIGMGGMIMDLYTSAVEGLEHESAGGSQLEEEQRESRKAKKRDQRTD